MNPDVVAAELVPHAFTVDQYHRMADAGIIDADERTELLDGLVVAMQPLGVPHCMTQARIFKYLVRTFAERALVVGGITIPLGVYDEPYPDLAVLANVPYDLLKAAPEPSQIYALIEIADGSLAKDTSTKRRLYARFAVPDYLVVDLSANVLLHFSHPSGGDYPAPRRLEHGETFTLERLADVVLDTDRFLNER